MDFFKNHERESARKIFERFDGIGEDIREVAQKITLEVLKEKEANELYQQYSNNETIRECFLLSANCTAEIVQSEVAKFIMSEEPMSLDEKARKMLLLFRKETLLSEQDEEKLLFSDRATAASILHTAKINQELYDVLYNGSIYKIAQAVLRTGTDLMTAIRDPKNRAEIEALTFIDDEKILREALKSSASSEILFNIYDNPYMEKSFKQHVVLPRITNHIAMILEKAHKKVLSEQEIEDVKQAIKRKIAPTKDVAELINTFAVSQTTMPSDVAESCKNVIMEIAQSDEYGPLFQHRWSKLPLDLKIVLIESHNSTVANIETDITKIEEELKRAKSAGEDTKALMNVLSRYTVTAPITAPTFKRLASFLSPAEVIEIGLTENQKEKLAELLKDKEEIGNDFINCFSKLILVAREEKLPLTCIMKIVDTTLEMAQHTPDMSRPLSIEDKENLSEFYWAGDFNQKEIVHVLRECKDTMSNIESRGALSRTIACLLAISDETKNYKGHVMQSIQKEGAVLNDIQNAQTDGLFLYSIFAYTDSLKDIRNTIDDVKNNRWVRDYVVTDVGLPNNIKNLSYYQQNELTRVPLKEYSLSDCSVIHRIRNEGHTYDEYEWRSTIFTHKQNKDIMEAILRCKDVEKETLIFMTTTIDISQKNVQTLLEHPKMSRTLLKAVIDSTGISDVINAMIEDWCQSIEMSLPKPKRIELISNPAQMQQMLINNPPDVSKLKINPLVYDVFAELAIEKIARFAEDEIEAEEWVALASFGNKKLLTKIPENNIEAININAKTIIFNNLNLGEKDRDKFLKNTIDFDVGAIKYQTAKSAYAIVPIAIKLFQRERQEIENGKREEYSAETKKLLTAIIQSPYCSQPLFEALTEKMPILMSHPESNVDEILNIFATQTKNDSMAKQLEWKLRTLKFDARWRRALVENPHLSQETKTHIATSQIEALMAITNYSALRQYQTENVCKVINSQMEHIDPNNIRKLFLYIDYSNLNGEFAAILHTMAKSTSTPIDVLEKIAKMTPTGHTIRASAMAELQMCMRKKRVEGCMKDLGSIFNAVARASTTAPSPEQIKKIEKAFRQAIKDTKENKEINKLIKQSYQVLEGKMGEWAYLQSPKRHLIEINSEIKSGYDFYLRVNEIAEQIAQIEAPKHKQREEAEL